MGGGRTFRPYVSISSTTTESASTTITCPCRKKVADTVSDSLGDAFQSIAQAVAKMQDAMWAMNHRIEQRDKTLRNVENNIRNHDKKVDTLRRRLRDVEPKLTISTANTRSCICPKGVVSARAFSTMECACGTGLRSVRPDVRETITCPYFRNANADQYSRNRGHHHDVQSVNPRRDSRSVDSWDGVFRAEPPRDCRTMGPGGDPRLAAAQFSVGPQDQPSICRRRAIHKSLAAANLVLANSRATVAGSPGICRCGIRDYRARNSGARGKSTPNIDHFGMVSNEEKPRKRKSTKGEGLSVELILESGPQNPLSDSKVCSGPITCPAALNLPAPHTRQSRSRKSLPRKRSTTTKSCPTVSTRSVGCTACTAPITPANFCCADHLEEKRLTLGRKIFKAAHLGKASEIYELLEEGADINYTNSSKWTPLHRAAVKGHGDAVSLLLDRGANVTAKTSYGYTALHLAAQNDRTARCVNLLIDAGSEIDCWNRSGKSALHLASESGNIPAVMVLLSAGASKNARDDAGNTAYDVAKTDCVKRLFVSNSGRLDLNEDDCACKSAQCGGPASRSSVD